MEATTRRPQLPALSYLDVDKVKREDDGPSRAPAIPPPVTNTSPTYYPPGPPPPYNQSASKNDNAWPSPVNGAHTPPASRRTSGDEPDSHNSTKYPSKQLLPSISEALGVDRRTAFAPSMPPSTTAFNVNTQTVPASSSPASKPLTTLLEPLGSRPTHATSWSQRHQENSWSDVFAPKDHTAPLLPPISQRSPRPRPTSQAVELLPPPPSSLPQQQQSQQLLHHSSSAVKAQQQQASPTHEPPPSTHGPTPTATLPPESARSSTFAYGYAPYTPRATHSIPPATSAGPVYQPSLSNAASAWQPDGGSTKPANDVRNGTPAAYGDSVKRHLDFFDLEAALNDIAASSGILMDFTRRYGDRLHHTARAGPDLASLPGLVEVDDMVAKSRLQLDALVKIRDVVLTQQAAYEQQAADQRQRKSIGEPARVLSDHAAESDDGKAGFMAVDTKKRRGRAAPPGRCHSCNRAETPEWRRGPDGARTLCNACGLHYAKLTRKQQGTNKPANMTSSNLRPKDG